ncbi:MAG: glycine zipper 2TM domain-containing protein [Deltaproteobacteria bacterium]|nr:glycine zipper 2TM domain-containing protein [Deltaproteobacteria bacterium]
MLDDPGGDVSVTYEPGGGREAAGTILGGAVGGVLGSTLGRGPGRVGGIIVGTLLGAILGHDIGRSLDEADELHAARVLEKNRTGQRSSWVNPDTGAEVTVVPQRTYETPAGEPCREYQTEVIVGGQKQQAFGTACRQPDGQWKIQP